MRKNISVFILFAIVSILSLCSKKERKQQNIAAIVGEDTITVAEADTVFMHILYKGSVGNPFWKAPKPKRMITYRKASLVGLIRKTIVKREAARLGIKIDSVQAAKALMLLIKKNSRGGLEVFYKTLDKIRKTKEEYLRDFKYKMIYDALADSLVKPIATPEESLKVIYNRSPESFRKITRKVSHICLYKKLSFVYKPKKMLKRVDKILKARDSTLEGEALEKAREKVIKEKRKRIFKILKRLRAGERFEALARKYSEDTLSAKRGGYVKDIPLGYRYPPYSDTAFALKTGTISGVVETQYGFFIIRADSDPDTVITPFKEAINSLRKRMDKGKKKMVIEKLIRSKKTTILMDMSKPPYYLIHKH